VPREEHSNSRFSSCLQCLSHSCSDLAAIFNLTYYSHLHVVNQKRYPLGITNFPERAGNI
jgi:hypothetical protein